MGRFMEDEAEATMSGFAAALGGGRPAGGYAPAWTRGWFLFTLAVVYWPVAAAIALASVPVRGRIAVPALAVMAGAAVGFVVSTAVGAAAMSSTWG